MPKNNNPPDRWDLLSDAGAPSEKPRKPRKRKAKLPKLPVDDGEVASLRRQISKLEARLEDSGWHRRMSDQRADMALEMLSVFRILAGVLMLLVAIAFWVGLLKVDLKAPWGEPPPKAEDVNK